MSTTDASTVSTADERKYTRRFAAVAFTLLAIECVWVLYGNDHWWFWPFYVILVPWMLYFLNKSYSGAEMNSLFAIAPYEWNGLWVFDDEQRGLVKEPFVAGADTMIETAAMAFLGQKTDFVILFGAVPFPGNQITLQWDRHEHGGDVYKSLTPGMMEGEECWLCPAMRLYFVDEAPKFIYVQLKLK